MSTKVSVQEAEREIRKNSDKCDYSYHGMLLSAKMLKKQNEAPEANVNEVRANSLDKNVAYSQEKIDMPDAQKMRLRRIAYYALPIMDCCFAWCCVYPIVTSTIMNDMKIDHYVVELVGAIVAIVVGLGLSLLARIVVSSSDEEDSYTTSMMKKTLIFITMFSLPGMYAINVVTFGGNLFYSIVFAFVSIVIQLSIITGYEGQLEALAYHKKVKHQKKQLEKKQRAQKTFRTNYEKFRKSFRTLALLCAENRDLVSEKPQLLPSQLIIYYGDIVCFRSEDVKLRRDKDGLICAIEVVGFPGVEGINEVYNNDDYEYISYMADNFGIGISLRTTIDKIRAQKAAANASLEDTRQQREVEQNGQGQESGPAPVHVLGDAPEPDDEQNDGVIW